MNGEAIKEAIQKNNAEIERLLTTNTFTLNREIYHLMCLNDNYRKQCQHEDDGTGICKYCKAEIK